jgi:hypothetical protein
VVTAGEQLVVGRVLAVSGSTVTLRTPGNKDGISITLDSSTAYKSLTVVDSKPSLASASQAAVTVGSNLIVEGTGAAGAKNLTARAVIVMPAAGRAAKP